MIRTKQQFDRIESLTKLQQKNITLLQNDLGELGCDLAVGFGNELTTPLSNIIDRLDNLERNINDLNQLEILDSVKSANRSALELERLTSKFWIYLELALEKKQLDIQEKYHIKKNIGQIAIAQSRFWHREDDLSIELENAKIAVTEQHCEWVVKELLDNAFKSSDLGVPVEIRGRVIDRRYYLWVSDRTDDSIDDQELVIGLKIVKKIVNIYDGEFAKTTVDENRMIYVTFPLA